MKVRLVRNIYHHSFEAGLTSKTVFKDYEWEISPIVGASIDDLAWHRNDFLKIEKVTIIADEGNKYFITLNSKKVDGLEDIENLLNIVQYHGWCVLD